MAAGVDPKLDPIPDPLQDCPLKLTMTKAFATQVQLNLLQSSGDGAKAPERHGTLAANEERQARCSRPQCV